MKLYLFFLVMCLLSCSKGSNKQSSSIIDDEEVETVMVPSKIDPSWEIGTYVDKYGERTNKHFLYQSFYGSINWSDSRRSPEFRVDFNIERDLYKLFRDIRIYMYEDDYPLVGSLTYNDSKLKFRNEKDDEFEVTIYGGDGNYQITDEEKIIEMLKEGRTFTVLGYLRTRGSRYATLRFNISENIGLKEMIDSVYSIENIDTIAALRKEFEDDSISNRYSRRR